MNRISFALAALLQLSLVFSCGKPEEDPVKDITGPALVSSSPEDGASGLVGGTLELVLTFDRTVMCPTAEQDRIVVSGGAVIDGVEAYMRDVTIDISGLEHGSSYSVTLPEGTVVDYDGNAAKEIRLTFSTAEFSSEQDIDEALVM